MRPGPKPPVRKSEELSATRDSALPGRLRELREHFALSQTAMARRVEIAMRTWQDYEAGKSAPGATALGNLHKIGVNLGWLLAGDGQMLRRDNSVPSGAVLIPRYDVRPSAGNGGAISDPDEPSGFMALDGSWIRRVLGCRPEVVVLVEAGGDSMDPTIADRDPLLVDTSDRDLRQNAIYVFRVETSVQVKRIQRKITGEVSLISDNPAYPAETLTKAQAEGLEVIGRVVWHGHKL